MPTFASIFRKAPVQFTCDADRSALWHTRGTQSLHEGTPAHPALKVQPTKLRMMLTGFVAVPGIKVVYAGVELATSLYGLISWLPRGRVVHCSGPRLGKNKTQQRNKDCAQCHASNRGTQPLSA